MDLQQAINNFYAANATEWAAGHNHVKIWGAAMDAFAKHLPGGKILEVGCGGGRDARDLISMGYDYTGTDIVTKFVEIAKKQNPQGKFLDESISVLDIPQHFEEESFDGFWASAILLHLPREQVLSALQALWSVTKENGVGFISIKEGDKVDIEDDERGKRLFVYWQDAEFRELLKQAGFEVLEYIYRPDSERTKWMIYIVKRLPKET